MTTGKVSLLLFAAFSLTACGGDVANSGTQPATSASFPAQEPAKPPCGGIDSSITDKGAPDDFKEGADVAGTTAADGLKTVDLKQGTGATVAAGQCLSVQYTGWLENGTKFDSSRDRAGGFRFPIGAHQVIGGWDEGLIGMKAGGRRRLTIPPALGYGPQGSPPTIPGNSTLVFIVEVVRVS
ncbi:MAG: hypothetical protein NVSMB17_11680 [Candidatus Dormibacteria bacterium]